MNCLSPSILAADFACLGNQIRAIDEANNGGSSLSAVAQQQLSELTAISRNVEMNRKSVERIETLFNSVVTSGSNGKRIRI